MTETTGQGTDGGGSSFGNPPVNGPEGGGGNGLTSQANSPEGGIRELRQSSVGISGTVIGRHINNVGGDLHETHIHNDTYIQSDEGRIRKISVHQHFTKVKGDGLLRVQNRVFFEMEVVQPLVQKMEECPFLVLAGDAGIGKTSLAQVVASLLHTRRRPAVEELLVCRELERNVRVNLGDLTGESGEFHKRGIILSRALTSGNEDVLRFFSRLNGEGLDNCLDGLRKSGSFLIITADRSRSASVDRLRGLGVLHEIETPPAEVLQEALIYLARKWIQEQGKGGDERTAKLEEMLVSEGAFICAELRGMTRIATFVREYLPQVLDGPLTLVDAIRRVKNLSSWLLEELADHPEVWCTVLSLVFCSASRGPGGVPWFRFDAFRRELSRFVNREMGCRRPQKTLKEICRGHLPSARAMVEPRDFPGSDAVRFESAQTEERLWEVLLGPGRDIVGTVVPLLRTLVHGRDPALGQVAASALGRIGQLDPTYITYPLLERWTENNEGGAVNRGTILGHLYRGILSAREDQAYREGFLQRLRARLRGDSVEEVRTILFSLLQIGTHDEHQFDFTLGALREVAEKWLRPEWEELREIADFMWVKEQAAELFKEIRGRSGTVEEVQELGRSIAHKAIFNNRIRPIFWAFQHTLTGLFFSVLTQRAVLDRLLVWSREDEESVGPLVAYLFLRPGGIGAALGRMAPARQADTQNMAEGSPFVELLHADPDATESLVRLLESVHRNIRAFPGLLQGELEQGLIRLLGSWAREGRSIPRLRPTVLDILSGLFESVDEEVSERILRLAQEPPSTPELEDLHQLAIEAVTRPARRRIS